MNIPPHAWSDRYAGYQPPAGCEDGPPFCGVPGFLEPGPFMPPPPPPFGDCSAGPPPPSFGGPPGRGGGGFWAPWMDGGFGMPPPPPPGCMLQRRHRYHSSSNSSSRRRRRHHLSSRRRFYYFGPSDSSSPSSTSSDSGTSSDGCGDSDCECGPGPLLPSLRRPKHQRAGVNMLLSDKFTHVHVFKKEGIEPWQDGGRRGVKGGFSIFKADAEWTVKRLMEALKIGDDKWAVTEVVESGNGRWYKGTTFKYKDERAAETLSKQGWTEKRGAPWGQGPVWLVKHKAE